MGQFVTKLHVVAGPVTVLKYWNQSPRLLDGISPLEQNPVHASIMSKLILTNAGSILHLIVRIYTVQGQTYTHNTVTSGLTEVTTLLYQVVYDCKEANSPRTSIFPIICFQLE